MSWNLPSGLLLTDQTHKFGAWVSWDAIASTHNNLNISLLQSFVSGTPYERRQTINTIPYVGDPASLGYARHTRRPRTTTSPTAAPSGPTT